MSVIHDTHTDTLVVRTCWCGIRFAVPSSLARIHEDDRTHILYCPLGHQGVISRTTSDKLRDQLANERIERNRERAEADQREAKLRDERDAAENRRRAEKAAKTRIKNRIAAGVCPCCNRTFQNLAAHMKGQHPDYAKTDA